MSEQCLVLVTYGVIGRRGVRILRLLDSEGRADGITEGLGEELRELSIEKWLEAQRGK